MLSEAKLVMTDKLLNMARTDQEEHPLDDDPEIETVELSDTEDPLDHPEATTAEDKASNRKIASQEIE